MSPENNLPRIEVASEFTFHYFDKPIHAIKGKDGFLYGRLQSLCDLFQLNLDTEIKRIQQHTILGGLLVEAPTSDSKVSAYLRLSNLAVWLMNLPLKEITGDTDRRDLSQFQQNAAQFLEEAFCSGHLTNEPLISELLQYRSPYGAAYQEAVAVLMLAKEQLINEGSSRNFSHKYEKMGHLFK